MDPIEHVAFVARSEHRLRVLEHLLESGSTTRYEFRDRIDASRSTVTRSLSALEDRGWITKSGNAYELTAAGQIVTDRFLSLTDAIETTEELSAFLKWFPTAEFDFSLEDIADETVITSTKADPYAPARAHLNMFEDINSFRGMLPSVDVEVARKVRGQIAERDLDIEMIVTEEIAETMAGNEYAEIIREMQEMGQFRVLVCESELPFYLGISNGRVQIGVENDEGYPQALLETPTDAMETWARDVYEDYRNRSRELEKV